MVASAKAVLGASATVELVTADVVDDGVAAHEATARHATLVVELHSAGNSVHVRALVVAENRFADRDLGFGERDRPEERGRTLGFAVASMMPVVMAAPPPVSPPPSTNPPPSPPPVGPDHPNAPPVAPRRWIGALDASGTMALALGGAGTSFGAMVAATLQPRAPWGIRLGVSPRFGELGEAQATTVTVVTSAGVSLQLGAPRPWTLGFGARLGVLAGFVRVTHYSADDPEPDHQSRWLPGFDAAIEGILRLAPALALVLGGGIEGFFGSTDVYVRGQPVVTMSPLRVLGELGMRARF
jgi:hypothetical protein